MRIVNLEEFRKLPEGVLFMEYHSTAFGPLTIKGETWESDYLECIPFRDLDTQDSKEYYEVLKHMEETGEPRPIEISYSREGLFEKDKKYAIIEKGDYDKFLNHIQDLGYYEGN